MDTAPERRELTVPLRSPRADFLENPAAIRRAVDWLASRAQRLDLAVAFVGQDWRDAIAGFRGRLRVICWLTSTNTNPTAVRQMRRREGANVRQRDAMHAKVYYAPGVGAVVGSANLSRRALADADLSGQDEAAILVTDAANLGSIDRWFESLWRADGTRRITEADIRRAKKAFDRARTFTRFRGGHGASSSNLVRSDVDHPGRRRTELLRLARRVRGMDLRHEIGEHKLLARVDPLRIDRQRLDQIAERLTSWITRRFLVDRGLRRRPLPQVRRALSRLFDESRDIEERLAEVIDSGDLAPLNVGTLSVLLYWRNLDAYPPFNWLTRRFLRDFRLTRRGASNASPAAYARWLELAEELSQKLDLPTLGHVDRMVWEHSPRD